MPPPLPPGFQVDQPSAPMTMPQPFAGPPPVPPAWHPPEFWRGDPSHIEPIPGGRDDPNRFAPTGDTRLTGPAYIASIPDPTNRAQAQAMLEGRIPFPTRGINTPHWGQIVAEVTQADPSYDANSAHMRAQAMTSFTGAGRNATRVASASRMLHHIGQLESYSDQLVGPDTHIGPLNSAIAWLGQTAEPDANRGYRETLQRLMDEAQTYFSQGGSGGEAERQAAIAQLSPYNSASTRREGMRALVGLLAGGMGPLQDQYNTAFTPGSPRPAIHWLDPEALAIARRYGANLDLPTDQQQNQQHITASGSGVIGPAGMLSGHPTGPVPPPPGPGGSPPPGGGNPPSGSPAGGIANGIGAGPPVDHHGDAVVFGMDHTPPPPPPNAGPLPGGAEFAGALQEAIRTQHFRSVAEAMRFATQLNPYLAQTVNQRDLAAAIRNPALAGVAVPHGSPPAPPPPPDISAQRGDQADPRQIAVQNALRRSIYNNLGGGGAMIAGPSGIAEMVSGPEAGAAALRGSEDVASVGLAPRMNALSDTITQGGTYQNNLDQQQAIDNFDTSNHPFARFGGEAATGAPFAMLGGANVGRQMIASGGYGALHGFNSGQGDMADRATNALVQGGIGAALPVAGAAVSAGARGVAPYLGGAARWVAGRVRPNVTPAGQEIAAAGAAENVPVSGPMLDPSTRSRMAYLESSLGGGGPVNQSLDATQAGIQNRVAEVAGPGAVNERGTMGERIQAAGRRFVAASGARIGAMYQRAAQMAGDTPVIPVEAVRRLEGHIAELQQDAGQNAPLINFLNTVRSDMLDQTGALRAKTVQSIRNMRTNLRGNIAQANLTHTPAERIMSDVLDGAGEDVNTFLGSVNPAANKLYQQADQQWAGRHAEITQIVDRLVGRANNPLGGGTVMDRVSSLAAGDVPRLRRVLGMLSPEERADLQATIASRAGYKSPDEPFNLQQFVSWQRALPNGAREAIFGADGAASIRNLTVLARALQDTRGALNNSRSGQVQNWAATLRGFVGGHWPSLAMGAGAGYGSSSAIAAGATTAALTGAGAVMRRLSAKALMNPDLSAWLPGALRASTPAAVRSALGRLSAIAARNPAIAQEVTGLRQALSGANDNFGTAAAASGADSQPQYGNDQSGYAPRQ